MILFGDIAEIIFKDVDEENIEEIYKNNQRVLSTIYIMKNDNNNEVKLTSTNIFKIFISNTPRCLKIIYFDLIDCIIDLY